MQTVLFQNYEERKVKVRSSEKVWSKIYYE